MKLKDRYKKTTSKFFRTLRKIGVALAAAVNQAVVSDEDEDKD